LIFQAFDRGQFVVDAIPTSICIERVRESVFVMVREREREREALKRQKV
jgi:hypothetical protein